MLNEIIKKIFGDPSEKKVAYYTKLVEEIHKNEEKFKNFSIEDIKNKTLEYKKLFEGLDFEQEEDSKKIKKILDDIKLEAFALVKQATKLINGQTFELSD
jgi:preprotein translocase subunit SecA